MNLKDLQYKYGLNETTIDLIVWIHSLFVYLFDALLYLVPKGSKTAHRHKLLVIKLDAIGDFILWLDFARGLRELYPAETHEVTLLANQAWGDFAAGIPWFDVVIPVDRMRFILNPFYRFRTLLKIRRQGFEMLIDPTFSREFQFSPAMARVSGAARRVAPQGGVGNQRHWQKQLSDRVVRSTPSCRLPGPSWNCSAMRNSSGLLVLLTSRRGSRNIERKQLVELPTINLIISFSREPAGTKNNGRLRISPQLQQGFIKRPDGRVCSVAVE